MARTRWWLAGAAVVAAAGWALREVPAELGRRPRGERELRVRRSPRFDGKAFRNPVPPAAVPAAARRQEIRRMVAGRGLRRPAAPVPVVTPAAGDLGLRAAPDGLHVLWLGHATSLVVIEGRRVLLDPVWSERCSPSRWLGPRRLHRMPLPLAALPPVDAVVISHDHYDHLDRSTIVALARDHTAPFLVPLGVGAHLEHWGVPAARIIELDWEERAEVAGLAFTATAARHFSGRGLARNPTLWSSWVIAGRARRVFYSGDTGYFAGFAAIGERHGPFDASLIQIGAYSPVWPDVHMTPEEGVAAHRDVRGGLLVPVHWGTFVLAPHPWAEPVDRIWREAKDQGVRLAVPRPGERIDVDDPPPADPWWQGLA